jgi:hypothetical protein
VLGWDNQQTNAFLHSYWMGLMTLRGFSYDDATSFGLAHERDGDEPEETLGSTDSNADLHNNDVGARAGVNIRPWWVAAVGFGATHEQEQELADKLIMYVERREKLNFTGK